MSNIDRDGELPFSVYQAKIVRESVRRNMYNFHGEVKYPEADGDVNTIMNMLDAFINGEKS